MRGGPGKTPVVNERGERLLAIFAVDATDDAGPAMHFALMAACRGDEVLLVHNRRRGVWELPGGFVDPGETAEACALREFAEETGHAATRPSLRARAELALPVGIEGTRAIRRGALFTAQIDGEGRFEPGEEIDAIGFWPVHSPPAGTSAIDAALLAVLAPPAQVQSVSPSRR